MQTPQYTGAQPDVGGGLFPSTSDDRTFSQFSLSQAESSRTTHEPTSLKAHKLRLEEHKVQLEEHKVKLELARETIRLRELELQIASERRREREVELELVKWKSNAQQSEPAVLDNAGGGQQPEGLLVSAGDLQESAALSTFGPPLSPNDRVDFSTGARPTFGQQLDFNDPVNLINNLGLQPFLPVMSGNTGTQTFDNILRELLANDPTYFAGPDMSMGSAGVGMSTGTFGLGGEESPDSIEPISHSETSGRHSPEDSSTHVEGVSGSTPLDSLSPAPSTRANDMNGNLHSVASSSTAEHAAVSAPLPSNSRGRSKKQAVSHLAVCARCNTPIAKLFLRGTPSELADEFTMHYLCERCASPAPRASGRVRKRVKQTDDVSLPTVCDVCLRGKGRGGIIPKQKGKAVRFTVEVVCLPCTEKYRRCSDCGGGSGRLGVGKWRCKELFYEGRKTCNLSHARLGTGELELAVWDVPGDVKSDPQISQVLDACETLWRDNVLRLAVPEILDAEEESPLGLRSYTDIETKILDRGWPAREHIMKDEGAGMKKYLALTWAKSRTRRTKAQADKKDSTTKDENVLFGNIRRTKIFYPAGCTLVGMWICNWDVDRRTIHMSTTSPFDARDFEDQSIVAVAETFLRIFVDGMASSDSSTLVPPSHWWLTYDVISPVLKARLDDLLIRRRRCFPLYEYAQRYPEDVKEEDFVEPLYTRTVDPSQWAAIQTATNDTECKEEQVISVAKFLGNSINWLRMQTINQKIYERRHQAAWAKKRKSIEDKPLDEATGAGACGDASATGKRRLSNTRQ